MTDLLIRDVPEDDLEPLRSEAAARGSSVQALLREVLHLHAVHIQRQGALSDARARLKASEAVPEEERSAVLDVMHDELEHSPR